MECCRRCYILVEMDRIGNITKIDRNVITTIKEKILDWNEYVKRSEDSKRIKNIRERVAPLKEERENSISTLYIDEIDEVIESRRLEEED